MCPLAILGDQQMTKHTSQGLLSRWLYCLVAQNNSGKTSFQRHLIDYLCHKQYNRLPRDEAFEVRHVRAPRNFETIACANRSYQEKRRDNGTIENYILNVVPVADVTILASHAGQADVSDIEQILRHSRRRGYNVAAVFFENALTAVTSDIAAMDWQERLMLRNPRVRESEGMEEKIQRQLRLAAVQFGDMLIARAAHG